MLSAAMICICQLLSITPNVSMSCSYDGVFPMWYFPKNFLKFNPKFKYIIMRFRFTHLLLLVISLPALAQKPRTGVYFTSSKQQQIAVYQGTIMVNGNKTYRFAADSINYNSKRNRIAEDKGNVFLFLDVKDAPRKNKLYVFAINNSVADSLMVTISSDVKDMDHDGLLELGGSEVPQVHPSADSVYYVSSKFYEINRGKIVFDPVYTEKIDRKVNGTYLTQPLDKNGNCCIAIPKPKGRP
jgi:hypothetical protein